ncbi:hypothetical protein BAUCODRAFT_151335 [Baudoinia panamericana UAMH 10762]|uniref:NADH-ubiquinone oxidoreductase 21kDa subunit N-terminal domain-containing protein n=1 Tax=Baudoinia panamericana (strain UAMH 10762) TaxID=717646 RepID=M2MND3_BAUPA|nr:uncharacterized protein BAUCODRAFT_151335 [Baudoinia panamericana UAMH 10762]EMC92953.1 hypothetical protein BAUCODRAFT_151335 [Baudoinia panamericana UAMH 10762]
MAAEERAPEVRNVREEYPELAITKGRKYVPPRQLDTDYPLIDCDPHISRVLRYGRPSDYAWALGVSLFPPTAIRLLEIVHPSEASAKSRASVLRLNIALGLAAGFIMYYSRSINRFYGFTENRREIDMDMREMTDRVKKGQPLYGTSTLTEYMQGVASRQSRYAGVWIGVMPWFNFVNHPHHGVDTAKYYRNAERELEAERVGSS